MPNTLANGSWTLLFKYGLEDQDVENVIPITFLPTGEIDFTRTSKDQLSLANQILQPSLDILEQKAAFSGVKVDFWSLLNFITVGYHWILLANLGQIAPTTYTALPAYPAMPEWEWYRVNFSQPISHPPTYNIFINTTLFDVYSTFLRETVLPLLNYSSPRFLPLNDTNRLQSSQTTFLKSYSCQIRRWKSPLAAAFSILTGIYVFVSGPYAAIILVASWLEKRKPQGMYICIYTRMLMVANCCEGNLLKETQAPADETHEERMRRILTFEPPLSPTVQNKWI